MFWHILIMFCWKYSFQVEKIIKWLCTVENCIHDVMMLMTGGGDAKRWLLVIRGGFQNTPKIDDIISEQPLIRKWFVWNPDILYTI